MSVIGSIARGSCLIGLLAILAGCVVVPDHGPREGYYDRPHHRYYHDRSWHECREHDEDDDRYCR